MFQRIVVPLDGSARAERAVPVAARLARGTGAQMLLLEVVSTPTSQAVPGVDVVTTLLGLAEKEGASTSDLIAISTHGRHGLERWVMGSVTERVLTTTKLPLLIVRPPAEA